MKIRSGFLPRSLRSSVSIPLSVAAQTAPAPQAADAPPRAPAPAIDGWTGRPVVSKEAAKPVPAPARDLTGTWEPANGIGDGIQPFGAKNMPDDGKPEHQLSYTPAGLAALAPHKPGFGSQAVEPDEINDPVNSCDPQGMPRQDLYEVRSTQIVQTPKKIFILYEYGKIWRTIWTDGRQLPQNPERRWFGYSVGKWVDDHTLVVDTIGTDERTWIDNAGRPHSGDMHIEERFHRVNRDRLELTVTLTDPNFYAKPWVALDQVPDEDAAR